MLISFFFLASEDASGEFVRLLLVSKYCLTIKIFIVRPLHVDSVSMLHQCNVFNRFKSCTFKWSSLVHVFATI